MIIRLQQRTTNNKQHQVQLDLVRDSRTGASAHLPVSRESQKHSRLQRAEQPVWPALLAAAVGRWETRQGRRQHRARRERPSDNGRPSRRRPSRLRPRRWRRVSRSPIRTLSRHGATGWAPLSGTAVGFRGEMKMKKWTHQFWIVSIRKSTRFTKSWAKAVLASFTDWSIGPAALSGQPNTWGALRRPTARKSTKRWPSWTNCNIPNCCNWRLPTTVPKRSSSSPNSTLLSSSSFNSFVHFEMFFCLVSFCVWNEQHFRRRIVWTRRGRWFHPDRKGLHPVHEANMRGSWLHAFEEHRPPGPQGISVFIF